MTPVIALVGRPNVGKSTLFNQMTRSRDALVADFPGLTRDRKYGEGSYEGQRFIVIDTGGLTGDEQGLDLEMARQSMQAVEEADIVLFLVDGRAGLTAGDELIADSLRRSGKQAHLVVNKTDGQDPDIAASDFYSLGFESTFLIAASHNRGIRSMLEILLPSEEEREEEDRADRYPGIRIGVVGRPNVGKSSLLNRLSRRERAIVTDLPGTTRDLLESEIVLEGVPITLLDTAGIRSTSDAVEQLGIARSHDALASADLVMLLFDLADGWTVEDQALREQIPADVPHLLVGNKADLSDDASPADVHLSAVTGVGEAQLVQALLERCGALNDGSLLLALNQRQVDLARLAAAALDRSEQVAADGLPWDFWTIDLREAIHSLGEITGEELTESMLDRIFSRFCIGK